jgi:hypothetical protein
MKTPFKSLFRELVPALACLCVAVGVCSALGAFNYFGTFGNPFAPDPDTVYNGHLVDVGTSDSWATGWTYARYYGPPARTAYAITEGSRFSTGYEELEHYGVAVLTYVSTGALFNSSTWDWGQSWVSTDYPWTMGAFISHDLP